MVDRVDVAIGDRVELRKPHPCGGKTWTVVRVGADIGLTCDTCGRRILIDRIKFNKRVKRVLSAAPDEQDS